MEACGVEGSDVAACKLILAYRNGGQWKKAVDFLDSWMAQAATIDGGDNNGGTVHGGAPHMLPDAATLNTLMPAMRRADRAAAGILLYDLLTGREEEEEESFERDVLVRGKGDRKRDGELAERGKGEGNEGGGGEREGRKRGRLTRLTLGDWAEFGRTGRLLVLERQLQEMEEGSKAKAVRRGEKVVRKGERGWDEEEKGVRELLGLLEAGRVVTHEWIQKHQGPARISGSQPDYRGRSVGSGSGGSGSIGSGDDSACRTAGTEDELITNLRRESAYNGVLSEGVDWQGRVCVKPDCVTVTEVILAKVALGQDEGALEVFWEAVGGREGGMGGGGGERGKGEGGGNEGRMIGGGGKGSRGRKRERVGPLMSSLSTQSTQSTQSTKRSIKADAHMCSAALSACRRRGLWWEADAVWAFMERRGAGTGVEERAGRGSDRERTGSTQQWSSTQLMRSLPPPLFPHPLLSLPLLPFPTFPSQNPPHNLTGMVAVMARAGKSERAQQEVESAQAAGVALQQQTANALLDALAFTYRGSCLTGMVAVMARAGRSERAEQVVGRAQAAGVFLQQQTANALLDALASTGDVRRTAALFSRLFLPSGNFSPPMDSQQKGLRLRPSSLQADAFSSGKGRRKAGLQADTFSFNALLKAHARRLQPVGAVQTVQLMPSVESVQTMVMLGGPTDNAKGDTKGSNEGDSRRMGDSSSLIASLLKEGTIRNQGSGVTSVESQEEEFSSMGMRAGKEQQEAESDSGDAKGKANKDVNGWAAQGPVEVFGAMQGMGIPIDEYTISGPVQVFGSMQGMGIAIDEYTISVRACVGRGGEGEAGREDVRRGMEVYGKMRKVEREEDGALEKVIWTLLRACEVRWTSAG
ncbi:unnamed protein product [Closterium sp. Yama58-4]|nr:unnamed protein product [Closterium sp. Yama58-4]